MKQSRKINLCGKNQGERKGLTTAVCTLLVVVDSNHCLLFALLPTSSPGDDMIPLLSGRSLPLLFASYLFVVLLSLG